MCSGLADARRNSEAKSFAGVIRLGGCAVGRLQNCAIRRFGVVWLPELLLREGLIIRLHLTIQSAPLETAARCRPTRSRSFLPRFLRARLVTQTVVCHANPIADFSVSRSKAAIIGQIVGNGIGRLEISQRLAELLCCQFLTPA